MPRKCIFPLPLWFYENKPRRKKEVSIALGLSLGVFSVFEKQSPVTATCIDFLEWVNERRFWYGERKCKECGNSKSQESYNRGRGLICDACVAKKKYIKKKNDPAFMQYRNNIRKASYEKHKDKHRANTKNWHDKNKARVSYNRRRWKIDNPEKLKRYKLKRNVSEIRDKSEIINNIKKTHCYWCGIKLKSDFHLDHVVPLSKGGSHTAYNLVAACSACNLSKGAKMPNDFLKTGQLELEIA
jgi:5-methylcytosine-specific restriction endonuclease McrA